MSEEEKGPEHGPEAALAHGGQENEADLVKAPEKWQPALGARVRGKQKEESADSQEGGESSRLC